MHLESRKTFMSDHNIDCSETNLPVSLVPTSTHNEPTSRFKSIDFNTNDWDRIRNSLNLVDWNAELDHLDTEFNSAYHQFVIPLLCFVIQTQS